jgi:hypothetical protein
VFIKQLENAVNEDEDYGFPKTSCHAFFACAVQYPALHEKVKCYAENALQNYDWYTDLDGEENTVTSTFAALALAFCEEQYTPATSPALYAVFTQIPDSWKLKCFRVPYYARHQALGCISAKQSVQ